MSKEDILGGAWSLAIVLVVVGIVLGIAAYISINHTCTVGVAGTAANITYAGTNADSFCSNPESWTFEGAHFYKLDQPQGVVLCAGTLIQQEKAVVNYTVRDTGFLDIVGSGLCKWYSEGLPSNP